MLANSQRRIEAAIAEVLETNQRLFVEERDKLERWAEDKLLAAEDALKNTKARITELKRDARNAPLWKNRAIFSAKLPSRNAGSAVSGRTFLQWKMALSKSVMR